MSIVVLGIVAAVLAAGVGLLIYFLMRRSQTVVPRAADRATAQNDPVVGADDSGRPITESRDGPEAPARDDAAFEAVLREEQDELHR